MISAVIIDDEQHSIDTLRWKLQNYCPDVDVVAAFDNPAAGVDYLRSQPPNLLFLDIEMPMLNGFDVLEELGRELPFDIIFTTAYDNFGIQAVKFSALDYLLKPVQNKELKDAIDKHLKKVQHRVPTEQIDVLLSNVQAEKKGRVGKIALASKRQLYLFVSVNDQGSQFYALNRQGIIYESFGIAGFDVIFHQVFPRNGDQRRIVLIKNLQPVQQHMADETKAVL